MEVGEQGKVGAAMSHLFRLSVTQHKTKILIVYKEPVTTDVGKKEFCTTG